MHKKLCLIGMLSLLTLSGCGQQEEKKAEAPGSAPAVEQAVQEAQKAVGTALQQAEQTISQAAPAVEEAVKATQDAGQAVVKEAGQAAEVVQEKAAAAVEAAQEEAASLAAKGEKSVAELAAPVVAEMDAAQAQETVVLVNNQGKITLSHRKHGDAHGCAACHGEQTPGPLTLGKEAGHALCLGCHKEKQAGPTSCTQCHQKKTAAVEGC